MSELKFKVGDLVADELGIVGEVISFTGDSEFPYRIREVNGVSARHAQSDKMHRVESQHGNDAVNHPKHYTGHPSGIECIQITEHMGFNLGNTIKYVWRADLKNDAIEDLEKAAWYLAREIQRRKNQTQKF